MEDKRNPLWTVLKTEWKFLGTLKKRYIMYMGFFIIAGIINLMTPLLIGTIFNSIQQSITSELELKKLIIMISLLLVIQIGFWAFHGTARVFEQSTSFSVHRNYTNSKIQKILELPVKWHKDHHSGDTIDKINRGRTALEFFSEGVTFQLSYAVLNIFVSLIILFFIDFKIAVFAFLFSSITLIGVMKMDKKLRKYYKELNTYSNKLSASIFDYLSNILTVITLRLKKTVFQEIDSKLIASKKTYKKSVLLNEIKWGVANLSVTFMVVLVLSFKAYTEFHGTGIIMVGTLYMLYDYLRRVGDSFFKFGSLYGQVTRYDARISGVYPIDEEFEKLKNPGTEKLPLDWKIINLKNLDFTYNDKGNQKHIENASLKFLRGEKIALIGESGSGKSTILSLIRGLYEPKKVKVEINDLPMKNALKKLRENVTLIPQDPEIFNNTIRYNITMNTSVKKEDLNRAIKMAQLKKVIKRLEKGLDTSVLEKGVSLSGGEKQRLALARGIIAAQKSDIILLDEPTSSVDSLNEMKIHESLFKVFKNKTIISSIHRLHLLNKFDYIYMFEKGKIVAEGNLKEIKKNPKFKYIWKKYGIGKNK